MKAELDQVAAAPGTGRTVVVGGGAVGLYAAAQLAARGKQVVLLEAGGAGLGSFDSGSYVSTGLPHTGVRIGRSRTLGGTTNLWGGQLVEFQPIDFDGREWLPRSKWPISYKEVSQYYRPTYIRLGVPDEFIEDQAVWRGISAKKPDLGPEFEVFLTRWMSTPNFAELFAEQLRSDPHLLLLTGTTAVGFRGEGRRITAVKVVDSARRERWIEAGTVILAAGVIENARLLLHSAADREYAAPWRENQNIGRYFQDHVGGNIGSFEPRDRREFFRQFSNIVYAGRKYMPKIRLRDTAQRTRQMYNTQVFFAFESEISEHMVYLKQFLRAALYSRKLTGGGQVFRNGLGIARYLFPLMWKYVWDHRVFVPGTARVDMHVQAEHAGIAESQIAIEPAIKDRFGLPQVILHWQTRGDDLESLRAFATEAREALERAGIGRLHLNNDLLAGRPEFMQKLGDTYHQAGGTVMADSSEHGVVDADLRVFGTENLYVTGAGVFPTTSNANTTFTAVTLTTRLVDHLTGIRSIA